MNFWIHVKEEIKRQNTTQEWIAEQCGISYATFRGWINYQRIPRADQAVAIAKALNTTVEYLVTEEKQDAWRPPPRYADIVRYLDVMDNTGIEAVRVLAEGYASRSKQPEKREA